MFKNHGTGVGLRPTHYSQFTESSPVVRNKIVNWVEVISENFMRWPDGFLPGSPIQNLERVRSLMPVHLHGVSMSLGSADPLNKDYLIRLKELMDRIQPELISDHLCWTGVDGENLHDLLPLPYTEATIRWVSEKILRAQDFLGRRMVIENLSSYVEFQQSGMPEWEFLSEIAKRADCGILLDINNVYVSSRNHAFNPMEYLKNIPIERVAQIHLAGHSVQDDGFLIDTHSTPVCDDVWALFRWFTKQYGMKSTMIERDENIPEWAELEKELLKIKQYQEAASARANTLGTSATL